MHHQLYFTEPGTSLALLPCKRLFKPKLPSVRIHSALSSLGLGLALLLLSSEPAWCGREDERISGIESQIQALDTVVQANKNPAEKTRLEGKLLRLRDELSILRERDTLEKRTQALNKGRNANPLEALREKLRMVDASEEDAKKSIQELSNRRKLVGADRDLLAAQVDASNDASSAKEIVARSNTEEQLYSRIEELRALSLQREAAEIEIELAHEGERLREELRTLEVAPHPNLRSILSEREALSATKKRLLSLQLRAEDLAASLRVAQLSLTLNQQKLSKFDDELALLEKQTGFFSSNSRIENLLTTQRVQKLALQERIPFLSTQLEALRHASHLLTLQLDLSTAELALRTERTNTLVATYLKRLRWPAGSLIAVLGLYLLINYIVLRFICRHETRPIARRINRYAAVATALGVLAAFLFDDLSMMAATMGVVSAALVISLQDVCASAFGWIVIMLAGKFRAGDRLEVDGIRGDVIDIDLLRTTLNEVDAWLDSDQATGRIVIIPNNFIFRSKVLNYSHEHPYIWGRINLTFTYDTSVTKAMELCSKVLRQETSEVFAQAQQASKTFCERYGKDNSSYEPQIYTKIADSGFTLSLFYVANYLHFSVTHSRISHSIMRELALNPDVQLSFNTMQLIHSKTAPLIPCDPPPAGNTAPFSANSPIQHIVIP